MVSARLLSRAYSMPTHKGLMRRGSSNSEGSWKRRVALRPATLGQLVRCHVSRCSDSSVYKINTRFIDRRFRFFVPCSWLDDEAFAKKRAIARRCAEMQRIKLGKALNSPEDVLSITLGSACEMKLSFVIYSSTHSSVQHSRCCNGHSTPSKA
jgi:hypothetical protein